jgi:glycerophosphoryl diester phosphodiesterase
VIGALLSLIVVAAPAVNADSEHIKIIAHRGGRRWAPENSMSAFKKSIAAHVDGIEFDIHKCKSGELVICHDEDVARTADGAGLIKDLTLAELRKFDFGPKYGHGFKDEHIATLEELLKVVDGKLVMNIEIKNSPIRYPGIEEDLLKLLESYKYPDKIVISSFDHDCLARISKRTSKYRLATLMDCLVYDLPGYSKKVGAKNWHPEFEGIRPDSVKAAHEAGLTVNPWTVNGEKAWQSAKDMHVDGIITDDPEGLAKFLGR